MLLVAATGVVALAASPAAAAGTLDQSYEEMSGDGSIDLSPTVGQTFTAGVTGTLDQVDFGLSRAADDASATVQIRTTSGGLPTDTVLASATVPAASIPTVPALVPIPIRPVSVSANTRYAIVLTDQGFRFRGATPGTYPGGDAVNFGVSGQWTFDDADLAFRTYVTQSAPRCKLLRLPVPATPLTPPIVICV